MSDKSSRIITGAVVLAILYFAKEVLVPLALATLLSFVLTPLTNRLQRWGLSRVIAVGIVTVSVFLLIGAVTYTLFTQTYQVAQELPQYEDNLREKIGTLKSPVGSRFQRTYNTLEKLVRELSVLDFRRQKSSALQVQVEEPSMTMMQMLKAAVLPVLKPLGTAAIVIVFVVFMLVKREELRDKFIRLIGRGKITVTTQAIDEATTRLSRFLLMQTVINGGHGLVVGFVLFLIGLPNAALWGILSAILRFIPYAGPWIAALLPVTLSFIVFNTWSQPILIILCIICLELVSNNFIEPWLLGSSTGISSMALIVSAVFWTWLWGGVGLLLSTPITVCLAVLGKYIPQLIFLHILLGDEPMLTSAERFYQRLLADDIDEAELLLESSPGVELSSVFETVVLPALHLMEQDHQQSVLDDERYEKIVTRVQQILKNFNEESTVPPGPLVLCFAGRELADEAASMIFAVLMRRKGIDAQWISADTLAGELVDMVEERTPSVICISALPGGFLHAKYLCMRLRKRFPKLPLLVGLWQSPDLTKITIALTDSGADRVLSRLDEGIAQIQQWLAVRLESQEIRG